MSGRANQWQHQQSSNNQRRGQRHPQQNNVQQTYVQQAQQGPLFYNALPPEFILDSPVMGYPVEDRQYFNFVGLYLVRRNDGSATQKKVFQNNVTGQYFVQLDDAQEILYGGYLAHFQPHVAQDPLYQGQPRQQVPQHRPYQPQEQAPQHPPYQVQPQQQEPQHLHYQGQPQQQVTQGVLQHHPYQGQPQPGFPGNAASTSTHGQPNPTGDNPNTLTQVLANLGSGSGPGSSSHQEEQIRELSSLSLDPSTSASSSRAFSSPLNSNEGMPGDETQYFEGVEMQPPNPPPGSAATQIVDTDENWENYVRNLYDHCYRTVQDHARENDIRDLVNELRIYTTSHRGKHSLLPRKPTGAVTLPAINVQVVANHFKVTKLDVPRYFRYQITWSDSPVMLVRLDRWLRLFDADANPFNGVIPLYSGKRHFFSPTRLSSTDEPIVLNQVGDRNVPVTVTVTLEGTGRDSMLNAYLGKDENGRPLPRNNDAPPAKFPEDTISSGNLLVKKANRSISSSVEVGNYCFDCGSRRGVSTKHDEVLDIMTGYFGSIRALEGGLNLNLDVMKAVFYKKDQPLTELWSRMITQGCLSQSEANLFWPDVRDWTRGNMRDRAEVVENRWKRLEFYFDTVRSRSYFIYAVDRTAAGDKVVTTKQSPGHPQNLIDFMVREYKIEKPEDLLTQWPALKVSKKSQNFLPWGLCRTTGWSRYSGTLDDRVRISLQRTVQERYNGIIERVASYKTPAPGREGSEFLFQVEESMMTVDARTLNKPIILKASKDGLECQDREKFNFVKHMFREPAQVKNWRILSFANRTALTNQLFIEDEMKFLRELMTQARYRGMSFGPGPFFNGTTVDNRILPLPYQGEDVWDKWPEQVVEDFMKLHFGVEFVLIFMTDQMFPAYQTLKYLFDVRHGVPSQVVIIAPRDGKQMMAYVQTMLMKINVKCGGLNFCLDRQELQIQQNPDPQDRDRTMLLGADITHGKGNKSDQFPSIAAVVGTIDTNATKYSCRLKGQPPPQRGGRGEKIEDLENMVTELLEEFHLTTGHYPDNILYFRDGVSESRFLHLLGFEGAAILKAARNLSNQQQPGYNPKLVIVLAVKRHHTRFFQVAQPQQAHAGQQSPVSGQPSLSRQSPNNSGGQSPQSGQTPRNSPRGKPGLDKRVVTNLDPGTVVISGVTHPREYDFFLCSHYSPKGTSRPVHYHVLLDQIGIQPQRLYSLMYSLCCANQRSSNTAALVSPVQYAHLAAFRAKRYMEYYINDSIPKHELMNQNYNAHINLRRRLWFL